MSYQSIDQLGQWIESDCSKNLEADIEAGWTNSLFRKSSASGMAEEGTVGAHSLNFCFGSIALLAEVQL